MAKMEEYTGEMTKHAFRACANESGHQGNMVWSNFIKVVRNKEDSEDNKGDNGNYGVSSRLNTQMEWLPTSGSMKKLFVHLFDVMDAYFSHAYAIKLIHRVKKR